MPEAAQEPEGDNPHVGSVEDEAHKLVRAAAAWFGTEISGAGEARTSSAGSSAGHGSFRYARETAGPDAGDKGDTGGHRADEEHDQVLCTGCPWCRAKAAAGPIGAETLDSLADLLSSAAVSLRHFADSRRTGQENAAETPADPAAEEPADSEMAEEGEA